MKENEEVNYEKLQELIEWQIDQGTDAIIIAGTTGESSTLTMEEHSKVIKAAVEFAKHRVPVVAGSGSNCTREAIYLTQEAEEAGADGILAVTPYYNKCTQGGLVRYYSEIAECTKLPITMGKVYYPLPHRNQPICRKSTHKSWHFAHYTSQFFLKRPHLWICTTF